MIVIFILVFAHVKKTGQQQDWIKHMIGTSACTDNQQYHIAENRKLNRYSNRTTELTQKNQPQIH